MEVREMLERNEQVGKDDNVGSITGTIPVSVEKTTEPLIH
jgi:hypothetical protein